MSTRKPTWRECAVRFARRVGDCRVYVGLACTAGWVLIARAVLAGGGAPIDGVVGLLVALAAARADGRLARTRFAGARQVRRGLASRSDIADVCDDRWMWIRSGSAP